MAASKCFQRAVHATNPSRSAIRTYYGLLILELLQEVKMNLLRNLQAEEERQAVIDKQNTRLLQRIIDVMTSKKKTFPPTDVKEANRKVNELNEIRKDLTRNH